jgi:hypothetical protein
MIDSKVRPLVFSLAAGLCVLASGARAAEESVLTSICRLIDHSARAEHLPVDFLTRLIWKESAFRVNAVSPKGAQGIAQFMPRTADERGLVDPFDPEQAIPKAAGLLAELRKRFGNLGLAAAAYNAGPARVTTWLAGQGGMPAETRDYVLTITGALVEDWKGAAPPTSRATDASESCEKITVALRRGQPSLLARVAPLAPWGVQLSGNFSKALALASFERARGKLSSVLKGVDPMIIGTRLRSRGARPFYRVRAPAQNRAEAAALCGKIHAAGGACVVLRS